QQVRLNTERIKYWLGVGAVPTETVRNLLKKNGIPINDQKSGAAMAINTPNPAQGIEQAFVVRASKSRPKRSR
ncbi:hypothetical protein DRQ53_16055, partial [bacterium]